MNIGGFNVPTWNSASNLKVLGNLKKALKAQLNQQQLTFITGSCNLTTFGVVGSFVEISTQKFSVNFKIRF